MQDRPEWIYCENIMNSFKRADRVADLIKMEISALLLKRVRDPRIGFVTITGVKVTDDLRSAKVFFVELGKDQCSEDVRAGLGKAAGFLRRELGRRLRLRRVPELLFAYDPSFAYGNRIERLLSEIHREEEAHAPED
jgi:ribosome-binding factor A